jgi:shikimate dehydrogenase
MRETPRRLVLIGHPVAHSLSPAMQNAALRAAGIPLTYGTVDVLPGDLEATLGQLVRERAAGNVTVPHKEAAARCCARVTAVAQRAGAVNTFWVADGALVGDNTDVAGFHNAVAQLAGRVPMSARVGVIGAGGAAAAVLTAVAEWPGCEARVWNRTPARLAALVARFPDVAVAVSTVAEALAGAALVINATTVGMSGGEMPVDPAQLPHGADVVDLVYRPGETAWVQAARAHGHRACDGLAMLVEQGALAFEQWFGQAADRRAMWRALHARGSRSAER